MGQHTWNYCFELRAERMQIAVPWPKAGSLPRSPSDVIEGAFRPLELPLKWAPWGPLGGPLGLFRQF